MEKAGFTFAGKLAQSDTGYYTPEKIIFSIVIFLVGVIFAVGGYRLCRLIVILAGFFSFAIITYLLMEMTNIQTWINVIIAFIAGLVGAVLFHCLLLVAFFFIGSIIGFLVSSVAVGFLNNWVGSTTAEEAWFIVVTWLAIVLTSIIFGVITLKFQRLLIIISSSIIGCFCMVSSFDYVIGDGAFPQMIVNLFHGDYISFNNSWLPYVMVGLWALSSLIFTIVQLKYTAKDYHHNKGVSNVFYVN